MVKSKEKKKSAVAETEEIEDPIMEKKKKVETMDVKIKRIAENPDQKDELASPIIGYFPSGYDPLKDSTEPKPNIKVYKMAKSRNRENPRMELVVGPRGSQLNFVGTSYSGEAQTQQLCKYALGILDKDTGVLKMVDIAANRIFRLTPKFGGSEMVEAKPQDQATEEMTKVEKEDKLKTLNNQYTTRKNIRKDVKREALRQTEDTEIQKDFGKIGIKINEEALEATDSAANAQNIPPYDLGATKPDMAYPLDKIIRKGEWDFLSDIFDLAEAGSEVKLGDYPIFVCNRIGKLKDVKDELMKRRMAGVLSYITHLIKFKDKHSMDGVSSAKRHKFPTILTHRFSEMFGTTSDKKARIPDENMKLLINYVLVLSLFADDFKSDPSDIAKDLRMNSNTLRDYYGYLGCKFVRENKVMLATLKVPLKFDMEKKRKRRG